MVKWYKEMLGLGYEELDPLAFYQELFEGEDLQEKGVYEKGKYNGIAIEVSDDFHTNKDGKKTRKIYRHTITKDLDKIKELLKSKNFVLLSPISYIGRSRHTENTRLMYAFALEIDNLRTDSEGNALGLRDLLHQMNHEILPRATHLVCSGNGVHLYFLLDIPIRLFTNVRESLSRYKKYITKRFWNAFVTEDHEEKNIQFESAFQGFRLVGGVTKNGDRTRVFRLSNTPVTIEYLNEFVLEENEMRRAKYERKVFVSSKIEICYNNEKKLTLENAKEKYPEWYEKRIIKKEKKGSWTNKRALYDWWKREIQQKAQVGHRYHTLMCLSIYAIKCGISYEELEQDAFAFFEPYEKLTEDEKNHFTKSDIMSALQIFQDKNYVTFPKNSIVGLSGIQIKTNKRNGRKQSEHLRMARFVRDELNGKKETWRNKDGRPKGSGTKESIVKAWREEHPNGKKAQCVRDTGLTKPTVYKWW